MTDGRRYENGTAKQPRKSHYTQDVTYLLLKQLVEHRRHICLVVVPAQTEVIGGGGGYGGSPTTAASCRRRRPRHHELRKHERKWRRVKCVMLQQIAV